MYSILYNILFLDLRYFSYFLRFSFEIALYLCALLKVQCNDKIVYIQIGEKPVENPLEKMMKEMTPDTTSTDSLSLEPIIKNQAPDLGNSQGLLKTFSVCFIFLQ